ncbi:glycosyltransferase family 39 protein [Nonomuraea sp. NPDC049141]|uniref:glycosyltransferase family 39 protein n=1 Tax=Nonomuraea sp. NPDC049141 TaxID=3155500 RepID=UPI0033E618E2
MSAPTPATPSVTEANPASAVPPIAWALIVAMGVALGVVLLAVSARYGYHRDELYFRVAGRHLDWGYPDQPPLLPLLVRGVTALFGDSLIMLRLPADLASAAGVVIAGLTAREMGGGRRAQLLTAAAYAVCPFVAASGHTFYTATMDLFLCTTLVWLVVRWVRTRDQRMLLAVGAVTALAANVKYLVVFLIAAIVAGLLINGPRDFLRRPALAVGAAVAVIAVIPGLIWQARHGWPQLEMARAIAEDGAFAGRPGFLPFQVLLTGVVLSWLWIYGLWRLFRSHELAPYRFLGYAYLLLIVVFLVTAGKPYYLSGFWAALWAAGAVEVERRGAPRGAGWVVSAPAYVMTGVVTVALTLPVYPVDWLARTPQPYINADSAETVGWREFAAEVARVYRALPAADRSLTTIVAGNYGQAGALDRYGPALGLPRAYSGHNGFWYFGRPADTDGPTIFVGPEGEDGAAYLHRFWTDVTVAGRFDNGVDLDSQEQGKPVWVCRGHRASWTVLWPQFKQLG